MEKFGRQFRVQDKVIQTKDDYGREDSNTDIEQIVKIPPLNEMQHCDWINENTSNTVQLGLIPVASAVTFRLPSQ